MKILSSPPYLGRNIKDKIEHIQNASRPYISVRTTYENEGEVLELRFDSEKGRDVKVILSKEDRAILISYILEKVIPDLLKKNAKQGGK